MTVDSQDIRWKQRFENLQAAYQLLHQSIEANKQNPEHKLLQIALIKAFVVIISLDWHNFRHT